MAKFKSGDVVVVKPECFDNVSSYMEELYIIMASDKGGERTYKVEDRDGDEHTDVDQEYMDKFQLKD